MTTTTRLSATLLALGTASFLAACAGTGQGSSSSQPQGASSDVSIVVDGNPAEWSEDAAAAADERYFYARFAVAEDQYTLEAGPKTLIMYLDTDGNPATGLAEGVAPIKEAAGADLEIQFSPRGEDGTLKQGVAITATDRAGNRTPLRAADTDFTFAPTYAASWYEARISRRLPRVGGLSGLATSGGRVRGIVVLLDGNGAVEGYADPFEVVLPPLGSAELASVEIPAPPAGSIRVMTYNVFKGRPLDRPDAFARIFKAVAPDVVLLQEWDRGDANEIKAWFTTLVPSGSGWQAVRAAAGDVAIVSRYPLTTLGPDNLSLPTTDGKTHDVRYVAATTNTPVGDLIVASMHLKCCGGMGGPEDKTRLLESQAINAALRQALAGKGTARALGGDLNLVATRPPLDNVVAGLDPSGGNLVVIEAPVLGDPGAFYTWSDPTSEFVPGRLDFLMLGGSNADVVHAFVLDTSRLSESALTRHGLHRDDTRQSDHLPVVADIVPRGP